MDDVFSGGGVRFNLAQANIAKMRAAIDDPSMQGFAENIQRINHLAEVSPGFIWRYEYSPADAMSLRAYDKQKIIFNMSVWSSLDALKNYVYKSTHLEFVQAKNHWFHELDSAHMVLWWLPEGVVPRVDDALEKISLINEIGANRLAFNFGRVFPPPSSSQSDRFRLRFR